MLNIRLNAWWELMHNDEQATLMKGNLEHFRGVIHGLYHLSL